MRVLLVHSAARVRRRLGERLVAAGLELSAAMSTTRAAATHLGRRPVGVVVASHDLASVLATDCPLVVLDAVPHDPAGFERWLDAAVESVCARARRPAPAGSTRKATTHPYLIAVGASTGGVAALHVVLLSVGPSFPPVVVVQHIPAQFAGGFVDGLDEVCPVPVCTAEAGQVLRRGHIYVAPGHAHLLVERRSMHLVTMLSTEQKRSSHRPSVDVLYESVLANVGPSVVGVLLTGLGKDGATGLKALRDAGAWTIAQDEETSVVWGMPGAAVALGAAHEVLPLDQIGPAVARRV